MHFKLGKRPARKHAKRLWLRNYINPSILKVDSAPPRDFGALARAASNATWSNVLGNADYGCCFWSAAFRHGMARQASVGTLANLDPQAATGSVLDAYSGATGFNPSDPQTDQGTDALSGMHYLQQTGIAMPDGTVHKIGSYAWINPQDFEELLMAFNLFDGLMLGLEFPASWEEAQVWDIVSDPPVGGHEVIGTSDITVNPDGIWINTWGFERIITRPAIAHYADEIAVIIAPDMFGQDGKSIAGFDAERLQADEQAMAQ